ncbi:hypothetical protein SBA3_1520005 [Candidatus Sulfopaludibacter sp. SbA3]|nr:hypothetical protein SBA3_1520005 [Candidatus Sulfopaludibacter sp. SbA3]
MESAGALVESGEAPVEIGEAVRAETGATVETGAIGGVSIAAGPRVRRRSNWKS